MTNKTDTKRTAITSMSEAELIREISASMETDSRQAAAVKEAYRTTFADAVADNERIVACVIALLKMTDDQTTTVSESDMAEGYVGQRVSVLKGQAGYGSEHPEAASLFSTLSGREAAHQSRWSRAHSIAAFTAALQVKGYTLPPQGRKRKGEPITPAGARTLFESLHADTTWNVSVENYVKWLKALAKSAGVEVSGRVAAIGEDLVLYRPESDPSGSDAKPKTWDDVVKTAHKVYGDDTAASTLRKAVGPALPFVDEDDDADHLEQMAQAFFAAAALRRRDLALVTKRQTAKK